jgi:hypothetical protein
MVEGLKLKIASGSLSLSSPSGEPEFFVSPASLSEEELSGESGLPASLEGDLEWLWGRPFLPVTGIAFI